MFEEILHLKHFFFSEKDSKLSKSVWESNELDLIIYFQTGSCRGVGGVSHRVMLPGQPDIVTLSAGIIFRVHLRSQGARFSAVG